MNTKKENLEIGNQLVADSREFREEKRMQRL
jgi:hypothetical protein